MNSRQVIRKAPTFGPDAEKREERALSIAPPARPRLSLPSMRRWLRIAGQTLDHNDLTREQVVGALEVADRIREEAQRSIFGETPVSIGGYAYGGALNVSDTAAQVGRRALEILEIQFGPEDQPLAKEGGVADAARCPGDDVMLTLSVPTESGESSAVFSVAAVNEVRRIEAWLSDRLRRGARLPEGEMISETIRLSPAQAEYILSEHNKLNRPVRSAGVNRFAKIIKEGRWRVTSQGISFDRNGRLIDGQHRLFAAVKAGMPIDIYATFGVHPTSFDVLDTGSVRGRADTLHVHGYQYVNLLAATARILHQLTTTGTNTGAQVDNDQIVGVVEGFEGLSDFVGKHQKVAYRFKKVSSSAITAAAYLIHTRSAFRQRLPEFLERLHDGAVGVKRSPIVNLRDGLLTGDILSHLRIQRDRQTATVASVILAWNLWVQGKKGTSESVTFDPAKAALPQVV